MIECRGDPRAMGEAQGRALRESVRACVGRDGPGPAGRSPFSLRPFAHGEVLGRGMGREIVRHYPHLSERIQGIAYGADLPIAALMQAFVRESRRPRNPDSPFAEAAVVVRVERDRARLTRRLGRREHRWIVRRSVPAVGFRSVELTLAWLATAAVGVNEAGVAAVLAPRAGASGRSDAPAAALLVQECLQRFDRLEGCIDWLLKRPASGDASIALADATGAAAIVDFEGAERTVSPAAEGLTVAGGDEAAHEALLASREADVDWPKRDAEPQLVVCAEPALRQLRVRGDDAAETVWGVDGPAEAAVPAVG